MAQRKEMNENESYCSSLTYLFDYFLANTAHQSVLHADFDKLGPILSVYIVDKK